MARQAAQEVIEQMIDPIETIEKGLSRGMDIVDERFSKMEAFLPELMMAAQTFDAAMGILEPEIAARKKEVTTREPSSWERSRGTCTISGRISWS